MADLKEGFMRDDDEGNNGINKRVEVLNKLFKKIDFTLWKQFEDMQIHPLFYSLR